MGNLRPRIFVGIIIVGTFILAGCIKPADPTPAATQPPPVGAVPTQAPGGQPSGAEAGAGAVSPSLTVIEQFVQSRGDSASGLSIFYNQALSQDQVIGFRYENAQALPCAGWLLFPPASAGQQPINGGLVCAADATMSAFAGWTPFLTSDGQPYTVILGRVTVPGVTAVSAVSAAGTSVNTFVSNQGFVMFTSGIQEINTITAINAEGNTVIADVPQQVVR